MLNNQVPKSKPQGLAGTKPQGSSTKRYNYSNDTTLKDSRSRYDKGMEIYRAGRVQLTPSGIFKVSERFYVDTEKMQCDCPDYRTRKESCKHIFAACLFVKNRGKQKIEHLEDQGNCHAGVRNGKDIASRVTQSTESERSDSKVVHARLPEVKDMTEQIPSSANVRTDATSSKPFDRQSTITRLAVLNTATEILKTHRKPIEFCDIVSLAAQLEKWALGS